jgi:parallel beta-helix repeat protein
MPNRARLGSGQSNMSFFLSVGARGTILTFKWQQAVTLLIVLAFAVSLEGEDDSSLPPVPRFPGPGGSIVLEDGLYAGGFRVSRSGKPNAPFVVRARHPQKAIIRGPGVKNGKTLRGIEVTGNYVVLDGLRVEESSGEGIFVAGQHVTLRNCVLYHNGWGIQIDRFGGAGILVAGKADDVRIEGTECYENREHGIYVAGGADRPTIIGNRLHDNGDVQHRRGGNGLQINADGPGWPTEKAIIQNNIAYRNLAMGISLQGVQDSLIVNNLLYDNHHAISLGVSKGSRNNRFFHNTVVARPDESKGVKRAVGVLGQGNNGPSSGNKFFNNILFAPGGVALTFEGEDLSKTESDYNLLWSGPAQPVVWDEKTNKKWSLGDWQTTGHDAHSQAVEPNFVDPLKDDFHLRAGSPAQKRGKWLEGVSDDLLGSARPKEGNPSLGAFEASRMEKK